VLHARRRQSEAGRDPERRKDRGRLRKPNSNAME
jgi:hypothetical protein